MRSRVRILPGGGGIQVLRNAFSGNLTPTHTLIMLITLNCTSSLQFFHGNLILEWPLATVSKFGNFCSLHDVSVNTTVKM